MKKSIFLFFAAILCAIGMNAAVPSKLYLDASGWGYGDARYAAYFMPQKSFVDMTKATGEVSVFEVAVPANQTQVIFVRMNGGTTENNWDNKWNQTGDLDIPTNGSNKFTPSGWDGATTTWSTYTYTPPTFYIAGDFVTPTWSENAAANKMDYADGVFSKSYDNVAASAHQFKITNGTWTNAIGYDQNKCSGTNCTVENGGGNIQFTPLTEGTVTITYTLEDGKVHITCPEPPAVEYNITYPATQTNYTLVAGPAKAQTGAEVSFTATPAEGYVLNVTYNGNVIAGNNNVYTFMMPATDVTVAITAVAATTLYYVDNNNWGNVNAYMWSDNGNNGSWPGAAMALVGTVGDKAYSYYSISFAQGAYTSIIFNGGGSQTADLTIKTAEPYFYDGAWYTWDDLLAKLAAPVVTYDYYIAGNMNGWNKASADYGMTDEDADGIYEKEITLAAGQDHQFKVTNGKWGNETDGFDCADVEGAYEEVDSKDGNVLIKLNAETTFTVKFDSNNKRISFKDLTPKEVVTYDYYIAGSLPGTAWQPNSYGLDLVEGKTDVYTATFALEANTDYAFKITDGNWNSDGDNTHEHTALATTYVGVSHDNDGNIAFKLSEAKELVVTFNSTEDKIYLNLDEETASLTYRVQVPEGTEACYIAGPCNSWAFREMTREGTTDIFTIDIVGAKETDEYKYACQADWAYAEVIEGGGNRTAWKELDQVEEWGKPVIVTYQLKGVGGWEQPGIELVQKPGNDKEYMLTCQAISATDAIKVVRLENGEIKDYYGNGTVKDAVEVTVNYDGAGNITLPAGTYNFYFDTNEPEKKLWIEAATDCEPTPDYTRTVGNNQFGTICLPFGGTITGAVLYQCVGRETGKVYLGSVNTLTAGVPYIFQATATELAVYSDGTTAAAGSSNGLHGTFDDETVVAVGNYILLGNALRPSNGEAKVNANRAYLVMSEVPAGKPQEMPGRRYISMDVQGENVETGVEDIITTDAPVKVIENGQLIIIRDGVKYNVQGQKL